MEIYFSSTGSRIVQRVRRVEFLLDTTEDPDEGIRKAMVFHERDGLSVTTIYGGCFKGRRGICNSRIYEELRNLDTREFNAQRSRAALLARVRDPQKIKIPPRAAPQKNLLRQLLLHAAPLPPPSLSLPEETSSQASSEKRKATAP